jgi:hypothetical protein
VEVPRNFYIRGEHAATESFMEHLTVRADGEWRRDSVSEERLARASDSGPMFCFAVDSEDEGKSATLILWMNEEGEVAVANVLARSDRDMSLTQTNAVIERFHAFAQPGTAEAGVSIEMTPAYRDIDTYISPPALQALRAFSGAANKATGVGHPNDLRRWMDFVIQAHLDGVELEGETLAQWLHEEGWDGERAFDLGTRYDDARRLLERYDRAR